MDPIEDEKVIIKKINGPVARRTFLIRWPIGVIYWLFPLVLLGIGYGIGYYLPAFRESMFSKWPVDESVWLPLVLLIILAVTWLLFDLFWVFSRETTSRKLQINSAVSSFMAIVFSIVFGYLINSEGGVRWWFIIPFAAAVVDVFATGWAAINNATQKPFMTERGRE